MNNIPYQLRDGLYLENTNKLLPWYKSLYQITKNGGQPKHGGGRTVELYWKNEKIFNGMQVSIKAVERDLGLFFIDIKHKKKFSSTKDEFENTLIILTKKFGSPDYNGVKDSYPWSRWEWGNIYVNIQIVERFVDYVSLTISNSKKID